MFLFGYNSILIFFIIALCLSVIMVGLSYLFAPKFLYLDKISAYECGFEPFDDARMKFNVHFYLIAILFLIFDLEIVFLLPWVVVLGSLPFFSVIVMCLFLFILLLGFAYEFRKGVLDW